MVKSPSKYLSRAFLKDLRENNYISWRNDGSFAEYSAEEVDEEYFRKCNELAQIEADKMIRKLNDYAPSNESNPLDELLEKKKVSKPRQILENEIPTWAVLLLVSMSANIYFMIKHLV